MKVVVAIACLAAQIWVSWAASTDPDDIPIAVLSDAKYTIIAEGIRAQFVAYGASITNLFINDTNGIERDIVVGFENGGQYERDRSRLHLGGVLGEF
jgi:aldose 1-epimerase